MAQAFRTIKRIDSTVQDWMDDGDAIEAGTVVYEYRGCTYGCVGSGIAVTRAPDTTPFIEVPRDALEPIEQLD